MERSIPAETLSSISIRKQGKERLPVRHIKRAGGEDGEARD